MSQRRLAISPDIAPRSPLMIADSARIVISVQTTKGWMQDRTHGFRCPSGGLHSVGLVSLDGPPK